MGEKKNRVTSPVDGEAFVTKDGRKLHIIAGRQITGRDIYAAAYLDRETYEEEYFLTVETCTGAARQRDDSGRVRLDSRF